MQAVADFFARLLVGTLGVFVEMSPWLLLGFLLSGVLYVYLPKAGLQRHLGRPGFRSVFKAALFGMPLPLCSCGVIPAALALRRHGASRGATLSFMISTPQTGVDSILATYWGMGGFLALMRPLFSTITAVTTGLLANAFVRGPDPPEPLGGREAGPLFETPRRFRRIVSYGLRDHLAGIYRWLLFGILLAALIPMAIPGHISHERVAKHCDAPGGTLPFRALGTAAADFMSAEGWARGLLERNNELLCMLLMIAIGVPLYICATGSIPMAMAFMQAGLSPGAAFVFLMVGPATNVTTIVMAWRYLGRRATFIYLASIVGVGILSGYVINGLQPRHGELTNVAPRHLPPEVTWIATFVLGGAILAAAWIDLRMAWRARTGSASEPRTLTIPVDGMTCGHCKATVESALRRLPGVLYAEANVSARRAEVRLGDRSASIDQIRAAIEGAGYAVPGTVTPPDAAGVA